MNHPQRSPFFAVLALALATLVITDVSVGKGRQTAIIRRDTQARDIAAVVKELDYLIETTRQLQKKHGGDKSCIRFNYPALLAQLNAARDGANAYLAQEVMELHAAPPPVVTSKPVVAP